MDDIQAHCSGQSLAVVSPSASASYSLFSHFEHRPLDQDTFVEFFQLQDEAARATGDLPYVRALRVLFSDWVRYQERGSV